MAHAYYDYGLEDKLLRKNIPGRYGTWEDDERGPRPDPVDNSDEDGREAGSLEAGGAPGLGGDHANPSQPDSPGNFGGGGEGGGGRRTGVKGVLQDYNEHVAHSNAARLEEEREAKAAYRRAAYGATRADDGGAALPCATDELSELEAVKCALRAHRLAELKGSASLPLFGEVREVSALELLSAIDDEVGTELC